MYSVLGTLFSFAGIITRRDVKILTGLSQGKNGEHYGYLQDMIAFEKDLPKKTGIRLFRQFHYTLDFILELLDEVLDIAPEESLAGYTLSVYKRTVCKQHPWWLQHVSSLAMKTMPTKGAFITACYPGVPDANDLAIKEARVCVENSRKVFDICEKLYVDNGYNDMPW